jgi:hypothetical protein
MATTTNYAWTTPDNSGLVKNGAQDIRTLGSSVDTSLWNVGFGQAGKNKIINGDFSVNQRNFTSVTTSAQFLFDRFISILTNGSVTFSAQNFTLGAAPVAGYEAAKFLEIATTGQSGSNSRTLVQQNIESVRTFAGQTVTLSFFAKATSGTPKIAAEAQQIFGSGGSPSTGVTSYLGQVTLSTSWARYSLTLTLPSISGKTLGTDGNDRVGINIYTSAGADFNSRTGSLGIQNSTIQIWGIQLEAGSTATPFQTATGTIQGELAACQRYYQRVTGQFGYLATGTGNNSTDVLFQMALPVQMRVAPTSLSLSATADFLLIPGNKSISAITLAAPKASVASFYATSSGLSANQSWTLFPNGGTSGANTFIDFSAEL